MKKKRPPRGRTWVALALVGFVLVACAVVWRRAIGVAQAATIQTLEAKRVGTFRGGPPTVTVSPSTSSTVPTPKT